MLIFTVQPLLSPITIKGESIKAKRNFSNQNILKSYEKQFENMIEMMFTQQRVHT